MKSHPWRGQPRGAEKAQELKSKLVVLPVDHHVSVFLKGNVEEFPVSGMCIDNSCRETPVLVLSATFWYPEHTVGILVLL